MRLVLALLLSALLAVPAAAQQPRNYAIVSLAADGLFVVRYDLGTGSNLDRNPRRCMPLEDPELERAILFAVEDAVKKGDPAARTVLLAATDPALFKLPAEDGERLAPHLAAIRPMAQKAGATHLILATKHRDEARLRLADGYIGSGRIEGVGFYVDSEIWVHNRETREHSEGFIAPFVYARLALVDLASGAVLREAVIREAVVVSNQRAGNPWEMHNGKQKSDMLKSMIRTGVARAVPDLLSP